MNPNDNDEKDIYDKISKDDNIPEENAKGSNGFAVASNEIYDWTETFVFALCVVVILFTFIFRIVTVDGQSMQMTLHDKERLLISDMLYTPKTGDIVVIQAKGFDNPLVKRVIATEGQTVSIDFNKWEVSVDGVVLDEPYVNFVSGEQMRGNGYQQYPFKVSKGNVFVMGDNRNNSTDSRYLGEIDARNIVGRVMLRVFPFNKAGLVKPATQD
jgi:signal peptidase I, bacterial type